MLTTLTIASPILGLLWLIWATPQIITFAFDYADTLDLSPDQITDADDGARVCLGFHEGPNSSERKRNHGGS